MERLSKIFNKSKTSKTTTSKTTLPKKRVTIVEEEKPAVTRKTKSKMMKSVRMAPIRFEG